MQYNFQTEENFPDSKDGNDHEQPEHRLEVGLRLPQRTL